MKTYWRIVALQVVKGMLVYSVIAWERFEILKVPGQILTSNMKCGYTIVPAGCCPVES